MSTGFLLADALAPHLRSTYHQGDVDVTVHYLVAGCELGPYRVMLKRNFDTACWVPPVGSRASHSIYYGDRMLSRVLERFARLEGLAMPSTEAAMAEAVIAAGIGAPKGKSHPLTMALDVQVQWLFDNCSSLQWKALGEWLVKAVASYGRHERAHARYTPQNLKQVNADLRVYKIPFNYFNLFEDARIEHHSRKDISGRFDWLEFEDMAPTDVAFNIFLRCIQMEGDADAEALASTDECAAYAGKTVGEVAARVAYYYSRACDCDTAEALYPIIAEFLAEFKAQQPEDSDKKPGEDGDGDGDGDGGDGQGGSGGGSGSADPKDKKGKSKKPEEDSKDGSDDSTGGSSGTKSEEGDSKGGAAKGSGDQPDGAAGDLSVAAEASEKGDAFFDEFEEGAEVITGTDSEGKAAEAKAQEKNAPAPKGDVPDPTGNGGGLGLPESITPVESGGAGRESSFLASTAGAMDDTYRARLADVTAKLMRLFKTHSLPAATEREGQRLSGRHLARGEMRWVHKMVFGGKGKRKYSLVFDCSGSMAGHPEREGKLLVLALNQLAKRGYVEGDLILSGYVGGRPSWLRYSLPVADDIILRIRVNHGAEGLQAAIADNLTRIQGQDDVFVVTDANITDAPLNRAMFARRGVYPVGLYAGPEENTSEMEKHFPQNIIRDRIEEVVDAMLTRNSRRGSK